MDRPMEVVLIEEDSLKEDILEEVDKFINQGSLKEVGIVQVLIKDILKEDILKEQDILKEREDNPIGLMVDSLMADNLKVGILNLDILIVDILDLMVDIPAHLDWGRNQVYIRYLHKGHHKIFLYSSMGYYQ
jgi:hypothetical protein